MSNSNKNKKPQQHQAAEMSKYKSINSSSNNNNNKRNRLQQEQEHSTLLLKQDAPTCLANKWNADPCSCLQLTGPDSQCRACAEATFCPCCFAAYLRGSIEHFYPHAEVVQMMKADSQVGSSLYHDNSLLTSAVSESFKKKQSNLTKDSRQFHVPQCCGSTLSYLCAGPGICSGAESFRSKAAFSLRIRSVFTDEDSCSFYPWQTTRVKCTRALQDINCCGEQDATAESTNSFCCNLCLCPLFLPLLCLEIWVFAPFVQCGHLVQVSRELEIRSIHCGSLLVPQSPFRLSPRWGSARLIFLIKEKSKSKIWNHEFASTYNVWRTTLHFLPDADAPFTSGNLPVIR